MARIPIALMVGLTLAACDAPASSPSMTTISDEQLSVEVAADEYRFIPATLTLGDAGVVEFRNEGGLAHTWTVLAEPIDAESQLGSVEVLAEARADIGQSATVEVSSIPPGTYQVVCAIAGHFSAGMVGRLVVPG
ncbi:MAG: cupredoxin domain-containing protein [Acidimicrobiia bacterium]